MLNPPSGVTLADYWSAIKAGNSQHIRMTFANGTVLDESDVLSDGFTIQDILNGDTDLTFGKAVMKQINIPFINSSRLNGLQWSTEFTLEMGVDISDSTKWVTVGKFHGERPDKIHYVDVINFTACDRMQWFEVEADKFLKELSLPKTFSQILSALCTYIGVTYEAGDELTAIKSRSFDSGFINSEAVTCRDLIALMAEACGCYAKITADGKLKMVWYATASHSVSADQEFAIDAYDIGTGMTWQELSAYTWEEAEQFTWADVGGYNEVFRVNGLNVKQTEDDIGVLYGNHVGNIYLIVDNPFLVINENTDADTYVKPIYERLREFGGYLPMNTQCIGDWLVESGDIITVDVHGDSVQMPVFCQTIHWNGGCTAVYEATGNIKREPISAGTRQKLTNGGKFHEFRNDIDQLLSRMGDAEGNISAIEQTVGGIETRVENAEGNITTLQQTASGLVIDVANKYTIRSGIDIKAEGIEISGGKYIKMLSGSELDIESGGDINIKSGGKLNIQSGGDIDIESGGDINVKNGGNLKIATGGTLDVDTNNFKISSANKSLESGNWKFDDDGLSFNSSQLSGSYMKLYADDDATYGLKTYKLNLHSRQSASHSLRDVTFVFNYSGVFHGYTSDGGQLFLGSPAYPWNRIYGTLYGEVTDKTTDETDYNNITNNGSYWIPHPSALSHNPSDVPDGYALLEVNNYINNAIFQRLWTKQRCYTRMRDGTWGSWYVEQRYTV